MINYSATSSLHCDFDLIEYLNKYIIILLVLRKFLHGAHQVLLSEDSNYHSF